MHRTFISILAIGALTLAACGDDSASDAPVAPAASATGPTTPDTGSPATTEPTVTTAVAATMAAATTVAMPASTGPGSGVPEAIISLSPTATEMLYALDAGDQVLAVDDFSNYPPEAADKMVGLDAYQPSVEAIAGLEPDLVITDGTNPDLLAQLDELGIDHWEGPAPATFDDVYAQIEQLGARIGRVGEAAEEVLAIETAVADAVAGLPELETPLTYYHELDNTYFSVTSDTFIGAVYAELGLVNVADAAGADTPYPQLSAEYIIDADPDLIFLACTKYCGETAESVAARPGWDTIAAVAGGGVIEMDDDIASRWGPRIADYITLVGEAVATVAAPAPAG